MSRTIKTNGSDIYLMDRPGGRYLVKQGNSYLLLTPRDAKELANALAEITADRPATTPAKARLQKFVGGVEVFD
ncbi:hypothetical protein [Mycolicibacterium elephantis]|uniref:Uncharacterized protein n=1 Tax=Mycolicibacterium elephantis DSM 44368 TaxID=1335622 RepID=A0A439DYC0_9MYCO|nr:hypothetical protein [Mycolicibacterium elephantis]MCV7223154.1 hypothetical protein [Mycolicibacterium elephantis]RWA22561.1 hypothetical protein MELE44368_12360 [Mycolicibacterium elephantis DSM 44368]